MLSFAVALCASWSYSSSNVYHSGTHGGSHQGEVVKALVDISIPIKYSEI